MTNINQYGRSMIEMLGVLAIIGVLSVGGIAGYTKAMMKFKINKTLQQITHIITNTKILYINEPNPEEGFDSYSYSTGENLTYNPIAQLILPEDMKVCDEENCEYRHIFGGEIEMNNSTYADKNIRPNQFITFKSLPKEVCVALATQNYGNEANHILSVGICEDCTLDGTFDYLDQDSDYNNSFFDEDGAADFIAYTHGSYYPIPIAKAAEKCSYCGEENNCSITITMF